MIDNMSSLPFDGAISRFLMEEVPTDLKALILDGDKKYVFDESYPYRRILPQKNYVEEMDALQIEIGKFQSWVQSTGQGVAILFEGRDAAGKGGSIKATTQNLNLRVTWVVVLSKPTEKERGEWYFKRYVQHFPSAGTITIFDRSWYNRAVIERVFRFCDEKQAQKVFIQVTEFEKLFADERI